MRESIAVFIVDDHPVVRAGLRELLRTSPGISVVGDAEDGTPATIARIEEAAPDVAIVDIKLKIGSGLELCRRLNALDRPVHVIFLSAFWNDALVRQALEAGADGYLLKDAEHFDLTKSITRVAHGETVFDTAISAAIVRQARGGVQDRDISESDAGILRLVATGLTNKAIAEALFLSHHTVRDRLSAMMASLGAKNRAEAVQIATQRGVI